MRGFNIITIILLVYSNNELCPQIILEFLPSYTAPTHHIKFSDYLSIHPSVRPSIHPSIFKRTRLWRINTIQLILPCRDIIIDQSFKSVNPLNRPWFPSYPGPLYQNEVKCSAFDIEMICYSLEIKRISTRKVMHLAPFWNLEFLELGSDLFNFVPKKGKEQHA